MASHVLRVSVAGCFVLTACSSGSQSASPGASTSGGSTEVGDSGASGVDASAAAESDSGVDAGPACPGVPIVPDDTGYVASGSNPLGITGSWFVYSDCADLDGVNCSMVTTPDAGGFPNDGGVMCTSGTTSTASGAWGAGIALELNDGPPQMPFDTVDAGITGFCFQLTGPTIPSTGVRVAFPTEDNNDNAYFKAVYTAGQHTVLFSQTAQGSWVTDPQPFEPTAVTLIQFQIPSSSTAPIPWNFCVGGLTAVVQ
ncbi:MAG TPA: hypothetical protein VEK07_08505 [Polyangiaceae bacterium]|nr:hypothetical protein [Polyangiaceae bacterium]